MKALTECQRKFACRWETVIGRLGERVQDGFGCTAGQQRNSSGIGPAPVRAASTTGQSLPHYCGYDALAHTAKMPTICCTPSLFWTATSQAASAGLPMVPGADS